MAEKEQISLQFKDFEINFINLNEELNLKKQEISILEEKLNINNKEFIKVYDDKKKIESNFFILNNEYDCLKKVIFKLLIFF